ncbi:MAG: aminoacetone oxidase family FAD-binding enzyme [Proteobacteria bacterium]|nr:aminoacetone oxidase family FAD-binding enzyme [Pseudomonadota bacterium]
MSKRELIIIGAGAAGMMAAAKAAEKGISVLLLEKMEKPGRKIRLTGKGRCNITNTKSWDEFSQHIYPKNIFLKSAFFHFSNTETIHFFERIGLKTVIERGDRVFPLSGQAKEVVDKLVDYLKSLHVKIVCNAKVNKIIADQSSVTSVEWQNNKGYFKESADAVIVSTGGLSYPSTGSDGDGYHFASELGHKIVECLPSLTAIKPKQYDKKLEGLSLKNIEIKLFASKNLLQVEFGDLDFTNNGIEGPLGFKISRKAVRAIHNGEKVYVNIDLKPALSEQVLTARLMRDISAEKKISLMKLLSGLLPKQLIVPFIAANNLSKIPVLTVDNVDHISRLVLHLKNWIIDIIDFTSFERSVTTSGGVSLDGIVSKNMKSKIFDNLFFAGEIIDLDGDTGGFNLQIAFSTGSLAGESAAHLIMKSRLVS